MAFKSLFLKGYSGVDEDDYSIAVYNKQSVYDSLHYVIDQVCIRFYLSCFFVLHNFFLLRYFISITYVTGNFFDLILTLSGVDEASNESKRFQSSLFQVSSLFV